MSEGAHELELLFQEADALLLSDLLQDFFLLKPLQVQLGHLLPRCVHFEKQLVTQRTLPQPCTQLTLGVDERGILTDTFKIVGRINRVSKLFERLQLELQVPCRLTDDLPEELAPVLVLQIDYLLLVNIFPVIKHSSKDGELIGTSLKRVWAVQHQSLHDY